MEHVSGELARTIVVQLSKGAGVGDGVFVARYEPVDDHILREGHVNIVAHCTAGIAPQSGQ